MRRLGPLMGLCLMWPALSLAATPKPSGCLIEPEQVADVGSSVTGVIEALPVKLGDVVKAGDAVAVLRADVERASVQVASTRSSLEAEALAAQANLTLAQQKVVRTQQLLTQKFVSPQALEQAQTEAEVARQRHKMAQGQQRIYRQERDVAAAQLAMRTLRSPISGIVIERYQNLGERVEDRPVIRVASINPLRVSLMMPLAQYGQINLGDMMTVRPELPGASPVQAQVNHVDKVVDAASNTFRVRLTLPNPGLKLPGGLRCKADTPTRTAVGSAPVPPTSAPRSSASAHRSVVAKARLAVHTARTTLRVSHTLTWQRTADRRRVPTQRQAHQRMPEQRPDGPWLTASVTLRNRH